MDAYTLLSIRSFLPPPVSAKGPSASQELLFSTDGAATFTTSANRLRHTPALTHISATASPPHTAPSVFSDDETAGRQHLRSPRDDGGSATAATAQTTRNGCREEDDDTRLAAPPRLCAAPLAFIAAHPCIRATLQHRRAPLTCPHGKVLTLSAEERATVATASSRWLWTSAKRNSGSGSGSGFEHPPRHRAVAGGCLDCAECQRGGALGRRAVLAYCKQELGFGAGRRPARREETSGGCAVGAVRIAQETCLPRGLFAGSACEAAPEVRFTITLYGARTFQDTEDVRAGLSPASRTVSPSSHFMQGYAEHRSGPLCSPSSASSADPLQYSKIHPAAAAAVDVSSDSVGRQLQLAGWWLRRCVAVATAQKARLATHIPRAAAWGAHDVADDEGVAFHTDSTQQPPHDSSITSPSHGGANRVMVAVAYARSLRASRAGVADKAGPCRGVVESGETTTSSVKTDALTRSTAAPASAVEVVLQAVQLSSSALTQCYHTLTSLPFPCVVRRLLVHYEHPIFPDASARRAAAGRAAVDRAARFPSSSPPGSYSEVAALRSPSPACGEAARHLRVLSPPTALTRSVGSSHSPLSPADAPLSTTTATPIAGHACCPLPIPTQLPALYAHVEELVLSGLPTHPATPEKADVAWVGELLRQLQEGIPASSSSSPASPSLLASGSAPRSHSFPSSPPGRQTCTTVTAAPCLRRLVLLEEADALGAARRAQTSRQLLLLDSAATPIASPGLFRSIRSAAATSPPPPLRLTAAQALATPVADDDLRSAQQTPRTHVVTRMISADVDSEALAIAAEDAPAPSTLAFRAAFTAVQRTVSPLQRGDAAASSPPRPSHFSALTTTSAAAPPPPCLVASPLEELYVARSVSCSETQQAIATAGRSPALVSALSASSSAVITHAHAPLRPGSPLLLTRTALPWMCHYTTLRSLNLSHSTASDAVCGHVLSALPMLRELHLSWCADLRDLPAVLQCAASRQVRVLSLVGLRPLTTETLENVCMGPTARFMSTVAELYLAQCPLAAVGCVAFACPSLTRLQLPDTTTLDATAGAGYDEGEYAAMVKRCGSALVWNAGESDGGGGGSASADLASSALSVQGYGGLIPLLSRLFPRLTQLKLHDVNRMLQARAELQQQHQPFSQRRWAASRWEEGEEADSAEGGGSATGQANTDASAPPLITDAELTSMRAAYREHLAHGEFHDLHRRLPQLRSLYLDGCTELDQLLSDGERRRAATSDDAAAFTFGGATLSLACAVHDTHTLERLLTWRHSVAGESLGTAGTTSHRSTIRNQQQSPPSSPVASAHLSAPVPTCLRELRLSGCRSLPVNQMVRVVLRCCPGLRVVSVADTQLTDAALSRLCDGLRHTLESIDLCGCAALTSVTPLLRCTALRHVRLPGGQALTSRTMSVECAEGLHGLCALLGRLCPDLRRLQLHSRGSMDAAEVAQVSVMGRWVAEVDLSQMGGINGSTMLALTAPAAPSNLHGVLTRVNLSYTAMNNTMLRMLTGGVVGPLLQELRLHGCHCVSDVQCLSTTCKRLRVLKLSGTSVDASALVSVLEGLPYLADLDVRYCARVRDVHWLAQVLQRSVHKTPPLQLQQQQQEERRRCSECPTLRAHRPRISVSALHNCGNEEAEEPENCVASQQGTVQLPAAHQRHALGGGETRVTLCCPAPANNVAQSTSAMVAASPLTGDGGRRRSSGGFDKNNSISSHNSGSLRFHEEKADNADREKRRTPPPALPTFFPAASDVSTQGGLALPKGSGRPGVLTSVGVARISRACMSPASAVQQDAVRQPKPLRCLTQVAFGNNHCYLTTSASPASAAGVCGRAHVQSPHVVVGSPESSSHVDDKGRDEADSCASLMTPAESTVVLQEAVPGLFAVLALWRPETRLLVLLRPGSMGTEEWEEVARWTPQLQIREVAV